VESLAVYASAARYFVVIAPTATHENQRECTFSSYSKQGWGRLEQWARLSGGAHNMHVYDDDAKLRTLSMSDSLLQCTQVYEGEFPHKTDRKKLTKAVLNIWAKTLNNHKSGEDEIAKSLCDYVLGNMKDVMFPHDLFGDVPWKLASTLLETDMTDKGKGKTSLFGRFSERSSASSQELMLSPAPRISSYKAGSPDVPKPIAV
jgi:hypothetical protein